MAGDVGMGCMRKIFCRVCYYVLTDPLTYMYMQVQLYIIILYASLCVCVCVCVVTGHSVSTSDETMPFDPPELFLDAVLTH